MVGTLAFYILLLSQPSCHFQPSSAFVLVLVGDWILQSRFSATSTAYVSKPRTSQEVTRTIISELVIYGSKRLCIRLELCAVCISCRTRFFFPAHPNQFRNLPVVERLGQPPEVRIFPENGGFSPFANESRGVGMFVLTEGSPIHWNEQCILSF